MYVVSPFVFVQWLSGHCVIRSSCTVDEIYCDSPRPNALDVLRALSEPDTIDRALRSFEHKHRSQLADFVDELILLKMIVPVVDDMGHRRPQLTRNRRRIEIDITWECDASCPNCDRSCSQAPTKERMSLDQIHRFITELEERSLVFEKIYVSGGEPTTHPELLDIMKALCDFRERCSPTTTLHLYTNGYSNRAADVLARRPHGFVIENSMKRGYRHPALQQFNNAKGDRLGYSDKNWTCGCPHSARWAMGLCRYGYYQCPVAGSIDRVLGLDVGRKTLPLDNDDMFDQMASLCVYCGLDFPDYTAGVSVIGAGDTTRTSQVLTARKIAGQEPTMSKSWRDAYYRYRKAPPTMTEY